MNVPPESPARQEAGAVPEMVPVTIYFPGAARCWSDTRIDVLGTIVPIVPPGKSVGFIPVYATEADACEENPGVRVMSWQGMFSAPAQEGGPR